MATARGTVTVTDVADGINATTSRTDYAYATSSDGATGFSTTVFSGALYIGTNIVSYTAGTPPPAQSTTNTDYAWVQFRGDNTAEVNLYQRTTTNTAPADPTGSLTYTFSSGSISTTGINGWSQDIPSSGGDYIWRISYTAVSVQNTVSIAPSDWSDAASVAVSPVDGNVQNWIFIDVPRTASSIPTPTDSPGVPTVPVVIGGISYNWQDSPPSNPSGAIWASQGSQAGGTGNFTWGVTQRLSGQSGVSSRVDIAYATNLPALQTMPSSGTRSNVVTAGTGTGTPGTMTLGLPSTFNSGTNRTQIDRITMESTFNSGNSSFPTYVMSFNTSNTVGTLFNGAIRTLFFPTRADNTSLAEITLSEVDRLSPTASETYGSYLRRLFNHLDGRTLTFDGSTTTTVIDWENTTNTLTLDYYARDIESGIALFLGALGDASGTLFFYNNTTPSDIQDNLAATFTSASNYGGGGPATFNYRFGLDTHSTLVDVSGTFAENEGASAGMTRITNAILAANPGVSISSQTTVNRVDADISFDFTSLPYPLPSITFINVGYRDGFGSRQTLRASVNNNDNAVEFAEEAAREFVNQFDDPWFTATANNGIVRITAGSNVVMETTIVAAGETITGTGQPGVRGEVYVTLASNEFEGGNFVLTISGNSLSSANALSLSVDNEQTQEPLRTTTWMFDPDLDNSVYDAGVNISTTSFAENQTASQALTTMATAIAALHSGITWDGMVDTTTNPTRPEVDIVLASGNTVIRPSLTMVSNSGVNTFPSVDVGRQSTYTLFDYANREIVSFSSSVAVSSDSDRDFIINRAVDATVDNTETPIDFSAVRSGSSILFNANTTGSVTGQWRLSANHGGGDGNIGFGTVTVVSTTDSTSLSSSTRNTSSIGLSDDEWQYDTLDLGTFDDDFTSVFSSWSSFVSPPSNTIHTIRIRDDDGTPSEAPTFPIDVTFTFDSSNFATIRFTSGISVSSSGVVTLSTGVQANAAIITSMGTPQATGSLTVAYSVTTSEVTSDGLATVTRAGSTDFTDSSFPSGLLTDNTYVAASAQGHNFIGERVVSWGEGQTNTTEPSVSTNTADYAFSRLT